MNQKLGLIERVMNTLMITDSSVAKGMRSRSAPNVVTYHHDSPRGFYERVEFNEDVVSISVINDTNFDFAARHVFIDARFTITEQTTDVELVSMSSNLLAQMTKAGFAGSRTPPALVVALQLFAMRGRALTLTGEINNGQS